MEQEVRLHIILKDRARCYGAYMVFEENRERERRKRDELKVTLDISRQLRRLTSQQSLGTLPLDLSSVPLAAHTTSSSRCGQP